MAVKADMFRLDGKTVAVIGAGGGIGAAVAMGVAEQGGYAVCYDVKSDTAEATAAAIRKAGGAAESAVLDITDEAGVTAALEGLAKTRGRLDGLVCTPAINVRKPIMKYSGDEFDKVVAVNLRGNFNVLMAAGRIMTAQKSGSVVLFSSIRSIVTEPGQSVYSMTKAGILQLAKSAATEWATAGVRVNAVGPGVTETPLTAPIKANAEWYNAYASKAPMNRWARADEMAGPTVFLLSDAASYVTGTIIYVDGGWLAADGRFTPPGM
ncbi:MAG: SDR family oxidoreductase [Acidobacteria bacterium]|nr:SDR family oxidoreductase [Acidobacteriota bacterium]